MLLAPKKLILALSLARFSPSLPEAGSRMSGKDDGRWKFTWAKLFHCPSCYFAKISGMLNRLLQTSVETTWWSGRDLVGWAAQDDQLYPSPRANCRLTPDADMSRGNVLSSQKLLKQALFMKSIKFPKISNQHNQKNYRNFGDLLMKLELLLDKRNLPEHSQRDTCNCGKAAIKETWRIVVLRPPQSHIPALHVLFRTIDRYLDLGLIHRIPAISIMIYLFFLLHALSFILYDKLPK